MSFGSRMRVVVPVLVLSLIPLALAQEAKLPDGWQQFPPDDFASAIRPFFESETFETLSPGDRDAVKARGRQLFLQTDLAAPTLNFRTAEVLHRLCRYDLETSVMDRASATMLARQDNWTDRPYAEIRAKLVMMMRLRINNAAIVTEARKWVAAGGTLAQVPAEDLQFEQRLQIFSDARFIKSSFAVEWNALLTPTQTGDYTFSLSPININAGHNTHPVQFQMTVSIGGQVVLDSSPDALVNLSIPAYLSSSGKLPSWVTRSSEVALKAGEPVQLRVTATAKAANQLPSSTLHALLYWQGPGISKTLIPTEQLTNPETGKPGLKATYSWTENGKPQSLTRTDPMIDFVWGDSVIPLPQDPTVSKLAADTMWNAISQPGFLDSLRGPPAKIHPFLLNPDAAALGLSTARRGEFLTTLLQRPELLDTMNLKTAVRFYQTFRFGNPDKAVEVLGTWALRHPDYVGEISNDRVYAGDERFACAMLGIFTTQQFPEHAALLQSQYLQLGDGRCSLPVAYTLACSYLGKKEMGTWVAFLDGKLADTGLTGDAKVNWLLARANAAEMASDAGHYPLNYSVPHMNPREGRKYLDQALQAAQSPEVKVRVAKEIAIRLAYGRRFAEAKQQFQMLLNTLPDGPKGTASALLQQLTALDAQEQQDKQTQANQARDSYLKVLKARRESAAQANDEAAIRRYDEIISAVSQSP